MGGTASSNSGGVPNGFIASGQGFFVVANSNTSVVFNNDMRGGNNTQFFKSESNINRARIWISCSTSFGEFSQILLGFDNNTTKGMDLGMDAIRSKFKGNMYLASTVNNNPLVIQGRPHVLPLTIDEIPLEVNAQKFGVHIFGIDSIDDQNNLYNVYLFDSLYRKTDLLNNGPAAVYLSDTGSYQNRFYLKVERKDSPNSIERISKQSEIYGYINDNQLFITSMSEISIKSLKMFSVTGSKIFESNHVNANSQLGMNIPYLESGVYIVSVVFNNGQKETIRVVSTN